MRGNRLAAMALAVTASLGGIAAAAKRAMGLRAVVQPPRETGHTLLRHRGINGGHTCGAANLKRLAKRRRNIRARAPK